MNEWGRAVGQQERTRVVVCTCDRRHVGDTGHVGGDINDGQDAQGPTDPLHGSTRKFFSLLRHHQEVEAGCRRPSLNSISINVPGAEPSFRAGCRVSPARGVSGGSSQGFLAARIRPAKVTANALRTGFHGTVHRACPVP